MKLDWRMMIVGATMGVVLAGCASQQQHRNSEASLEAKDPTARAFQGNIVSLRPLKSTMLISKNDRLGNSAFPNIIRVKYDAQTKFYLDGAPTTIDKLRQYMPVQVTGHMRDGQMFADAAKFSSMLPPNVKPAGSTANAPQAQASK